MKRTVLAALALLLLVALCLSGCSSLKSPLDPKNPVTVTMWHNYGGDMQASMDLLIDEFNSTVGKEQGVLVNVTSVASSADLNKSLAMILDGDPGAPEMPDIFTGYPKIAVGFKDKGLLVNLDRYFTAAETAEYVDAFINEGRLSDGGLYVFPIAKSTEILYLNKTLFEEFAAATGVDASKLGSFEGIAELSAGYYKWTDDMTPGVPGDGKQFFAADSWFNLAEVGMAQLSESIFDDAGALRLDSQSYAHIFGTIYKAAVEGGFAVPNGYSSDLSKTGDLICSVGSSAGILFYGNSVTYADGTVKPVEYSILPYPVFEGGSKTALQRGGGLMVSKTDEKTEYAAAVFIKWLTASEQNRKFISKTGYLPVTKRAFESDMAGYIDTIEDARIKKMLTAVMDMYRDYTFFTAPNLSDFDSVSKKYESGFKALLNEQRAAYLESKALAADEALGLMTEQK